MNKKMLISSLLTLTMLTSFNSNIFAYENFSNNKKYDSESINLKTESSDSSIKITRIEGMNRYETSIKTKEYLDENGKSEYLVIASGESFADSLSGGLLASEYGCPLVLVKNNDSNDYLKKAYNPQDIKKVFVVGGKTTISDKTVNDLGISNVKRLSGKSRFETSYEVDLEIQNMLKSKNPNHNAYTDVIAVYDGYNFPDALAAIPFMYNYNKRPNDNYLSLYPDKGDLVERKTGSVDFVFGGKSSVPEYGYEKTRFAGENRYETAKLVASAYKNILNKDIDTVVLVSGENYADALSSTPIASLKGVAILLTEAKNLNLHTREFLSSNKNIKNVIIVGGESSVSNNIAKELETIR